MEIRKEIQQNNVASEVEALVAVVIPILQGTILALNREVVKDAGGIEKIKLRTLARLYRPGDGDCGICFEYAVHDAIIKKNPALMEIIDTALSKHCKIRIGDPTSILFGAEKTGNAQLIKSVEEYLTDDSVLLSGSKGRPVYLKRHISQVVSAFRRKKERENLPHTINGLWKADLFVGKTMPDQWVGTTVKINKEHLEAANGLRLAVVPAKHGKSDKIELLETKNLIVCPVPYDRSFMEIFYAGWAIVKQFLFADAKLPGEIYLPRGADRQVCKFLEERRDYPVLDVLKALEPLSQPQLLITSTETVHVDLFSKESDDIMVTTVIAPISL